MAETTSLRPQWAGLAVYDLRLTPPNWIWLKGVDRTTVYANTPRQYHERICVKALAWWPLRAGSRSHAFWPSTAHRTLC